MTVVDAINVVTPQSALGNEDKINVDTVITKGDEELGLEESESEDLEYESDSTGELIRSLSTESSDDTENKEMNVPDSFYVNENSEFDEEDDLTLNGSLEEIQEYDYHYNFSSALDRLEQNDIGLVCCPIQKRLQAYKHGANFTIMCVGESGAGKTSFINTLFDSMLMEKQTSYSSGNLAKQNPGKTTTINHHKLDLIEDGFKLRLNVIDTPGFGDFIDNKHCWYPITRYIDEQYRRLVYQENQPDRKTLTHNEVHVCLYFILPTAIGLSQLDIDAMRNLSTRVNLVPIISKADGFTNEEITTFKQRIRNTLKEEDIQICELMDEKSRIKTLINQMPLSIINSIEKHTNKDGDIVRGRKYSWGVSEVENKDHCDFLLLRDFLIESYMGDLISSTEKYYQNYRKDFMKYRLFKAINLTLDETEMDSMGIKDFNKEVIVPSSRGSWRSISKYNSPSHPNLDELIDVKDSISVLQILNRITLPETEKELVELNPSYLEMEKYVKKKFTVVVQQQNQKFKDWKRTLYEKQDKFNKDIEQVHQRLVNLQEHVKSLENL